MPGKTTFPGILAGPGVDPHTKATLEARRSWICGRSPVNRPVLLIG